MANKLKIGMQVRALPQSEFYRTGISAEGAEGIVAMINHDRAVIELTPESLMKVSTAHFDYSDSHGIKREIAIIRTDELEVVSEAIHKSNFRPASAFVGGVSSLVGAGCFLPIALLAGLVGFSNFVAYFFSSDTNLPKPDIVEWVVPLIVFFILSAVVFGFALSFVIDFRLKRSDKVRNAVVIDLNCSYVGRNQYCYVYCLYDDKIMWQKVSYSSFGRYKVGNVVKVHFIGDGDKYFKIV